MSARSRLRVLLAALLAAWLATRSIDGAEAGFVALGPAFALFLPLLSGRYIGERGIERLATARRVSAGQRVAPRSRTPRRPGIYAIAGGRLIAGRLAGRAPPLAA